MKIPQTPPEWYTLLGNLHDPSRLSGILELSKAEQSRGNYLHWDKLRRYAAPSGYTTEEWWLSLKLQRQALLKPIELKDTNGRQFQFCIPDIVLEHLHLIDVKAGWITWNARTQSPILNPEINTWLDPSWRRQITSSQLEGAATTREVAKEMIRSGRPPRNNDEPNDPQQLRHHAEDHKTPRRHRLRQK